MKPRTLNIVYSRDVHHRGENDIGVLTYCRIEEEKRNGKKVVRSKRCTYEIRKDPDFIPKKVKRTMQIMTNGRRAA